MRIDDFARLLYDPLPFVIGVEDPMRVGDFWFLRAKSPCKHH